MFHTFESASIQYATDPMTNAQAQFHLPGAEFVSEHNPSVGIGQNRGASGPEL